VEKSTANEPTLNVAGKRAQRDFLTAEIGSVVADRGRAALFLLDDRLAGRLFTDELLSHHSQRVSVWSPNVKAGVVAALRSRGAYTASRCACGFLRGQARRCTAPPPRLGATTHRPSAPRAVSTSPSSTDGVRSTWDRPASWSGWRRTVCSPPAARSCPGSGSGRTRTPSAVLTFCDRGYPRDAARRYACAEVRAELRAALGGEDWVVTDEAVPAPAAAYARMQCVAVRVQPRAR
jgi:hypothetical protein